MLTFASNTYINDTYEFSTHSRRAQLPHPVPPRHHPVLFMGLRPQHTRCAEQIFPGSTAPEQNRIGFHPSRGLRRLFPHGAAGRRLHSPLRLPRRCAARPHPLRHRRAALHSRRADHDLPLLPRLPLHHRVRTHLPRNLSQPLCHGARRPRTQRTAHQFLAILQRFGLDYRPGDR